MNLIEIGKVGQDLVLEEYLKKGFTLVAKNFEYRKANQQGRLGEIDLIFTNEKKIYFVEVKTRTNNKFGQPIEQISRKKLQTLYKAILFFLSKKEYSIYKNYVSQFDAGLVLDGKVEIIPNCYYFDSLF